MASPILIATRGSALALAQANWIQARCRAAFPDETFELRIIKTAGDKMQAASLSGGELPQGIFTKEIEDALLRQEADLAVHSLKDLPVQLPAGLKLGAVSARADVRDVLIYRDLEHLVSQTDHTRPVNQTCRAYRPALNLRALPFGATLATSSTRRRAQVLEQRPDLKIVPLRGNVGTRLQKLLDQPELDATLLAAAGLQRLDARISAAGQLSGAALPPGLAATPLPVSEMLPCPGQAAIGVEVRAQDRRVELICAALDHADTRCCVEVERAFLAAMGGGCHLAVAGYAELHGDELLLRGVSYLAGSPRRGELRGPRRDALELGGRLAASLR